MKKTRILFLCGANSCRSQMAEGWARHLGAQNVEVYSAGQVASHVQPDAIRVMAEKGIDISSQFSKTPAKVPVQDMDYIITLCAEGAEFCPTVPGPAQRLHWPIEDPVKSFVDEEALLASFRKTRDHIAARVKEFLTSLK